jgi:hypothetical protein
MQVQKNLDSLLTTQYFKVVEIMMSSYIVKYDEGNDIKSPTVNVVLTLYSKGLTFMSSHLQIEFFTARRL